MMRRLIMGLVLFGFAAARAAASDVAFIYPTEEVLRSGKPVFGVITTEGILAPADVVLGAGGDVYVGTPGESVKKATLVRLDKDLNVALLRAGERLVNPELQAAHRQRAKQLSTFLPVQMSSSSLVSDAFVTEEPQESLDRGPALFQLTVNKAPITKDVVHIKPFLRKGKFSVEMVVIATEPVSNFTFRVHANPKLGFANRARSIGSEAPPTHKYEYKQTVAAKPGKKLEFPLEAHFIDEKNYEVYLDVESKDHFQRKTVYFRFD